MALKPGRNEVVIPAYTAPGLTLPIRKLGLTVKLCDISLKTFNLDIESLGNVVNGNTLAVVPPHMFGLSVDLAAVRAAAGKDVVVIQDFAQSLGSDQPVQRETGPVTEFSFGSFGRGKNFSLYHGGLLTLATSEHYELIKNHFDELPSTGLLRQYKAAVMFPLFSCLVQPGVYQVFHNILSSLKSKSEQTDFSAAKMGGIQVSSGEKLFKLWKNNYEKRVLNGLKYYEKLENFKGIALPAMLPGSKAAFNRFPVLVEDISFKQRIAEKLSQNSIEASFMYLKPVHMLWDLGYKPDDLPNARYFAEHLITLPSHGIVSDADIAKTVSLIESVLSFPRASGGNPAQ
jgi:dTDP-4-amino-4,6-dideoxygalactose transaminase